MWWFRWNDLYGNEIIPFINFLPWLIFGLPFVFISANPLSDPNNTTSILNFVEKRWHNSIQFISGRPLNNAKTLCKSLDGHNYVHCVWRNEPRRRAQFKSNKPITSTSSLTTTHATTMSARFRSTISWRFFQFPLQSSCVFSNSRRKPS